MSDSDYCVYSRSRTGRRVSTKSEAVVDRSASDVRVPQTLHWECGVPYAISDCCKLTETRRISSQSITWSPPFTLSPDNPSLCLTCENPSCKLRDPPSASVRRWPALPTLTLDRRRLSQSIPRSPPFTLSPDKPSFGLTCASRDPVPVLRRTPPDRRTSLACSAIAAALSQTHTLDRRRCTTSSISSDVRANNVGIFPRGILGYLGSLVPFYRAIQLVHARHQRACSLSDMYHVPGSSIPRMQPQCIRPAGVHYATVFPAQICFASERAGTPSPSILLFHFPRKSNPHEKGCFAAIVRKPAWSHHAYVVDALRTGPIVAGAPCALRALSLSWTHRGRVCAFSKAILPAATDAGSSDCKLAPVILPYEIGSKISSFGIVHIASASWQCYLRPSSFVHDASPVTHIFNIFVLPCNKIHGLSNKNGFHRNADTDCLDRFVRAQSKFKLRPDCRKCALALVLPDPACHPGVARHPMASKMTRTSVRATI
ncbi:hypothetical protein C8R44DRAFT_883420 [Mycena epipterygia]|nr:hypothetical protein C8R44DRAFT_883420 [Mycena epipterygia]